MRRYASYALITVAFLTFGVWAVSQFVQPILPASINASLILFIAALLGVIGILGQFKDVVELFRSFGEHSNNKLPGATAGPVQVILGNVTVNVIYIVQSPPIELSSIFTVATQLKVQPSGKPVPRQAPPIPPGFTGRANEIAVLKRILLQESRSVALIGLGGIGKTALVAALAHDADIERRFSDGTLWAEVGRFGDVREILSQWIAVLDPSEPVADSSDLTELLHRFRVLTRTRRILIVLDDVNEKLAPQAQSIIKAVGPMCKVLITSRSVSLPGVQALVSLDVLPEKEALLLLEKEMGKRFTVRDRALAREIVFLLGYHPLALRLAGSLIRATNIGLDEYREKLRTEMERTRTLDEVREQSVSNIRKSLDYVFNHLSSQEQNRLKQLSVFRTMSFDKQTVSELWEVDLSETENLLSKFVSIAFLSFKDGSYWMHPLVYEYLKERSQQ